MEKTKDIKKNEKNECEERYLNEVFSLIRKMENLTVSDKKTRLNGTELRLIGETLSAKYVGKRLISTQLAKRIGVTRSAISQIVNRLEEQGIVKRVADDVDRKIAYIELTDEALKAYSEDLKVYANFVGRIVKKFGAEKFDAMCALLNEFCDLVEIEKTEIKTNQ